jgi:MFS family permease
VFNILDRANVGFARLGMTALPGLTDAVIDIGFGLFYVGYLLFEVPSNLMLRRLGPRLWISRIMISWGLVSALTAWATGPASYFTARILLGVAEAGFFPGIIYYLTGWVPAASRGRIVATFMLAIPLANIVGSPLSGGIMDAFDGAAGLAGWQWLFLLEGLPTVLLGLVVLRTLLDDPRQAAWLDADERRGLENAIAADDRRRSAAGGRDSLAALLDPRVWLLVALYASVAVGTNATGAYLPKLVKAFFEPPAGAAAGGLSLTRIGLLSMLPHLASIVAMLAMSRLSDRWQNRSLPIALSLAAAGAGWLVALAAPGGWAKLGGLCLAQAGMMAVLPVFWPLPSMFLGGAAAAAGIALINSVANIGGIFAPWVVGRFGLLPLVATMAWGVAAAAATWWLVERPRGRTEV